MRVFPVRFALLAVAALLAVGAAVSAINAETLPIDEPVSTAHWQEADGNGDDGIDVVPVAAWTLVAVVVGGIILGTFYLLKRRVGGFPENPDWVAPISIEESHTFPKEGDYGDQVPSAQAHAEH